MRKVQIALLGCGKQGAKHLAALRTMPGVETLVADVDGDAARALGQQHDLSWTADVDAVLGDQDVQAMVLCTPTPTHAPLILRAVGAGKDFFCEKPLCLSLAEAREIARLVEASGQIGAVGYIYRFAPIFERGHALCTSGAEGPLGPTTFSAMRIGGRGSHRAWKHNRASGGGARSEMLVHMLDLALWYFGVVEHAEVLTEQILRPTRNIEGREIEVDAEDYIVCRLRMQSGVEILLQADMVTPVFTQFVEVQGQNGSFMGSIQPELPSYLYCDRPIGGYEAGTTDFSFPHVNLYEAMMSDFVDALRERKQPPRCTINDSLAVMQTLEQLGGTKTAELVA